MSKRLEAQLAEVRVLRSQEPTEGNLEYLRRLLAKAQGPVVAEAASVAGEWNAEGLGPDLARAFQRLKEHGLEDDPQCWGKIGLVKALRALGWSDPQPFIEGCRITQLEPVWGGKEDSAAPLRVISARSLADCASASQDEVMNTLVDLLADPAWTVRAEAAQAIANTGYPEAARLLRLKVRLGDAEPRVLGTCLDGLLRLEKSSAVGLVAEYLAEDRPERPEALAALAASSLPEAVGIATAQWERVKSTPLARVLLANLAASPCKEALDFLLNLVAKAPRPTAQQALKALEPAWDREEVAAQLLERLRSRDDASLLEEYEAKLIRKTHIQP